MIEQNDCLITKTLTQSYEMLVPVDNLTLQIYTKIKIELKNKNSIKIFVHQHLRHNYMQAKFFYTKKICTTDTLVK